MLDKGDVDVLGVLMGGSPSAWLPLVHDTSSALRAWPHVNFAVVVTCAQPMLASSNIVVRLSTVVTGVLIMTTALFITFISNDGQGSADILVRYA